MSKIICGKNLQVLRSFEDGSFDLIYIDPPFNTGKRQARDRIQVERDEDGADRRGFGGRGYRTVRLDSGGFADAFGDYQAFLAPRLREAHRLLKPHGSLFFHIDYREAHYCKVLLDAIFGRDSFMNEIIWAYDYGARSKRTWPAKHDTIFWYAKNPKRYTFNYDRIDRIPYMAPNLISEEKRRRGKTPTDVWWHTIVPTNGKEKTGYPTQKPLGIVERIVRVHSNPGDRLLDFFAGSGTLGEAAANNGSDFVLIDENEEAAEVMAKRLAFAQPVCEGFTAADVPTAADA